MLLAYSKSTKIMTSDLEEFVDGRLVTGDCHFEAGFLPTKPAVFPQLFTGLSLSFNQVLWVQDNVLFSVSPEPTKILMLLHKFCVLQYEVGW